ncbi:MAG: hypothetical protein IT340_00905 [Chloroflexi bacterium]|nr:hypothetical protein [Chloroflexota bacterium]
MYYYPTPYPCVVKDGLLRVERTLSENGDVLVDVGQRVVADEVVAIGRGSEATLIIDAAADMGVPPGEVVKGLTRQVGATYRTGETMSVARAGLRRREVRAAEDGVLVAVDAVSGQIRFRPASSRGELKAHVAGTIEAINGRRGVTIATTATHLHGIWGIGDEAVGVVHVLTQRRDEDLRPEMLDARAALAVVVAGRAAGVDALKKAAAVGVRALVLGSLDQADLRSFLESQGRAGPRWYVGGPDWRLPTPSPVVPFTLIVTEGFGRVPMAALVFETLRECEGREASLAGTTRLRAGLSRPEIIIPSSRTDGRPATAAAAVVQVGTRVRLVDPHSLGQAGAVVSPPTLRPAGDGILRDMVDVELDGGARRSLPLTNLEVLA